MSCGRVVLCLPDMFIFVLQTVTSDQTVTVTVKSGDVVISTQSFVYNYIVAQITSVTPSDVLTVHGKLFYLAVYF